jgi:hypothetical protein
MTDVPQFNVFLCHNSKDKPAVIELAKKLEISGLKPWLDEWELPPGLPWQPELERQIDNIQSAAVCIGNSGLGPWQRQEIDGFLRQFVDRRCPVIPVLLADAPQKPELPLFLEAMTWIDFRPNMSPYTDPMVKLVWGITGKKPDRKSDFENSERLVRGFREKNEPVEKNKELTSYSRNEIRRQIFNKAEFIFKEVFHPNVNVGLTELHKSLYKYLDSADHILSRVNENSYIAYVIELLKTRDLGDFVESVVVNGGYEKDSHIRENKSDLFNLLKALDS